VVEGRRWLEELLSATRDDRAALTAPRAKALNGAGVLAREQGDYRRASALLEEGLALFRDLRDEREIAWSLTAAMAGIGALSCVRAARRG
jgi:hypothetical protein